VFKASKALVVELVLKEFKASQVPKVFRGLKETLVFEEFKE